MSRTHYDFIVIGSGAAGAASAWRLCQRGYKVACLERGKEMDASKYPSSSSDWESRKQTEFNPVSAIRQSDSDYPVDDSDSPIAICNFNAVGGSTILYSGHFPRFQPQDFKMKSIDGLYEDWPITYQDLKPYFELNEYEMSASGLVGDPMYPDIENLLPPVSMGKAGELIAKAFNQKGWHWWPSPSAISTRNVRGRNACINLGPCNTGCPQGAKSSADITYIARARQMGLELFTDCFVDSVIVKDKKAQGVVYFDADGQRHELLGEKVILAASAIGTPRLLLNSQDDSSGIGIANSSGLVGKNLMIHPLGYVEGVFEETLDTDIGPQGCMIYSLEHYRNSESGYDLGFMMHMLRGTGPVETALSALNRRKLKFGERLENDFNQFYKKQLSISIICDDFPQTTNYLELSDEKDRFGTPGIKVTYQVSDNTTKMMRDGMSKAKEIMKLAGAKKTYAFGPVRNTGWHLMGTCKMGNDAQTSVVNATGETHDVKDLFVVDSSCFVTGSCVNPANTIQAVALYLTDDIIKNHG
jgi:choline dehydrogenase-like flavoprotein